MDAVKKILLSISESFWQIASDEDEIRLDGATLSTISVLLCLISVVVVNIYDQTSIGV